MSRRRWIVNASPLIFLAQIDQLPLLKQLADEVLVPFSVRDEVLVPKKQKLPIELPDWLSLREDLLLLPKLPVGILEPASLRYWLTR